MEVRGANGKRRQNVLKVYFFQRAGHGGHFLLYPGGYFFHRARRGAGRTDRAQSRAARVQRPARYGADDRHGRRHPLFSPARAGRNGKRKPRIYERPLFRAGVRRFIPAVRAVSRTSDFLRARRARRSSGHDRRLSGHFSQIFARVHGQ